MFIFLFTTLVLALMRFGAVEPWAWRALALAFIAGFAVWSIDETRRAPDLRLMALTALSVLLAVVDPKLALGPMAGIWAWLAVRRKPSALIAFLHCLLAVGVFEAGLGLFQYFAAPGWIFGYMNTHYDSTGTLINRNHFAGLLGMLIPVALGLAYVAWLRHRDAGRAYVYLLASGIMGLALTFSLSRMGILSLFATLVFLSVLAGSHSLKLGTAFLGIPLVLLVGGALWIGVDVVVERYDRLFGEEGIQDSRRAVFRDTLSMIADNPMGIGPGAYRDTFRRYQRDHNGLVFTHAHNDYLETAAEWGVPIAAAFWLGILFAFGASVRAFARAREPEKRGSLLAALGAIAYILAHSLTDFNLQIPSNAMLFFTFVAVAIAVPAAGPMSRRRAR